MDSRKKAPKATKRKASPTEKKKKPSKSIKTKSVPQQPSQTIQERLNSNNGKFIDPDSLITLFTKIPFTAGEIVSLRRTCVWWNHVLSSNALWKGLFQRDFDPSEKCMVRQLDIRLCSNFVTGKHRQALYGTKRRSRFFLVFRVPFNSSSDSKSGSTHTCSKSKKSRIRIIQ